MDILMFIFLLASGYLAFQIIFNGRLRYINSLGYLLGGYGIYKIFFGGSFSNGVSLVNVTLNQSVNLNEPAALQSVSPSTVSSSTVSSFGFGDILGIILIVILIAIIIYIICWFIKNFGYKIVWKKKQPLKKKGKKNGEEKWGR